MKIVLLFSLFLLSIGCFVMCGLCGSIRRSMGRLPDDATHYAISCYAGGYTSIRNRYGMVQVQY